MREREQKKDEREDERGIIEKLKNRNEKSSKREDAKFS